MVSHTIPGGRKTGFTLFHTVQQSLVAMVNTANVDKSAKPSGIVLGEAESNGLGNKLSNVHVLASPQ